MNWNKIMSLVIVSIFVLSSLSVFNTSTKAKEEFVDSITIEVRTNKTDALDDVANGDLEVFLSPISGGFYEDLNNSWREQMDTWVSIGRYQTMLYNPAHTVTPFECNVSGEYQFNPFAIKEIRQAQNLLINRERIVEEMYDGFGEPRYLCFSQRSPGYDDYFEGVVNEFGYNSSGNREKGIQKIQDAMKDAKDCDKLEGELRKGNDGFWEYKPPGGSWKDIELEGLPGPTDLTADISEHVGDLLQDCGFKVNIKYRQLAINYMTELDPASLKWHFHTGSWFSTPAQYYQENLATRMYAGWIGYMPGGYVSDADYRYGYKIDGNFYGNHTLENITKELYNGHVNDEQEYWNKMVKTAKLGLNQSVRIFLVTEYNFYPFDGNSIYGAATDVVAGWSDVFTPRTMRTQDGTLTAAQYSSQGALYMDNWNELGGSDGINGQRQKKMLTDQGSVMQPSLGTPIPMRTDWKDSQGKIESDYYWKNSTLRRGIEVPSDAVIYNSSSDQWEDIGENKTSAVKVTYDVVEGKWHSGANLTLRDIMGWHAWSWDMAFEDGDDDSYYHRELGMKKRSFFNSIVGEKWDEKNQTYTIWGDYTFPEQSKIGYYYSIWPAVPYYQYQAAQFLVNQDDEYIPDGTGTYSWNEYEADYWIDWLSKDQCENITETLQNMIDKDYNPWFMREENNAPITVSQEKLNEEMQHLIDFYSEHEHIFASNGPFLLENYDDENQKIQMVRFTQEDGYPWPEDRWMTKHPSKMIVSGSEVPDEVEIPNDISINIDVKIDEDYPSNVTRNVTIDDGPSANLELIDEVGYTVKEKNPKFVEGESRYHSYLDTSELSPGEYTVRFTASIPAMIGKTTFTKKINLTSEAGALEVSNFEMNPSVVKLGESVSITANAKNTGDRTLEVDVIAGEEIVNTYTIEPSESIEISEGYTFENEGLYKVKIGNETREVLVEPILPNISIHDFNVTPTTLVTNESINITATASCNNNPGTVKVYVDNEVIVSYDITPEEDIKIEEEYTFNSTGNYTIMVGRPNYQKTIEVVQPVVIEDVELSSNEVNKGDKVKITAKITNNDDIERTIRIEINNKTVKDLTVQPGTDTYTYENKFDEKGTYEITIGDQSEGEVKVKAKETPGFGLIIIAFSLSLVAIYRYNKKINR